MNAKPLVLALVCLSLTACAALKAMIYGRPNPLTPLTATVLGSTPRDDIIRQFGAPDEINRRVVESRDVEVFYYYDRDDSRGLPIQAKYLACEFAKGQLTAWSYFDSSESPPKSFDENERFKLVKGQSSRKDAERLLGLPAAKALLPSTINQAPLALKQSGAPFPMAQTPPNATEAWQYFSQNIDDYLNKSAQKTLTLFFDANGVYISSMMMQELLIKSE